MVYRWIGTNTGHRWVVAILYSHSGMALNGNDEEKTTSYQTCEQCTWSLTLCVDSHVLNKTRRKYSLQRTYLSIQTGRITCPRNGSNLSPWLPSAGEMSHGRLHGASSMGSLSPGWSDCCCCCWINNLPAAEMTLSLQYGSISQENSYPLFGTLNTFDL